MHAGATCGTASPCRPRCGPGPSSTSARHPAWAFDFLTTEPLGFVTLHEGESTLAKGLGGALDPSVTLADVTWLRDTWHGGLVVKGILDVA